MVDYSQLRQVKNQLDMKEPTHIQATLMELQSTHRIMEMEFFIEIVCRITEMITGISIRLQAGFRIIGSCPAFFCLLYRTESDPYFEFCRTLDIGSEYADLWSFKSDCPSDSVEWFEWSGSKWVLIPGVTVETIKGTFQSTLSNNLDLEIYQFFFT